MAKIGNWASVKLDALLTKADMVGVPELANILGMSRRNTWWRCDTGKVPGIVQIGREYLVPRAVADALRADADNKDNIGAVSTVAIPKEVKAIEKLLKEVEFVTVAEVGSSFGLTARQAHHVIVEQQIFGKTVQAGRAWLIPKGQVGEFEPRQAGRTPYEVPANLRDRYLTMPETAKVLGLTRQRIHQLLQTGKPLGPEVGSMFTGEGGVWLIPKAAVEEFAQGRPTPVTTAPAQVAAAS